MFGSSKGYWEKVEERLKKNTSKEDMDDAKKITKGLYHDKNIHSGTLDANYPSKEIKAIKKIQEITGAAERIGELERIIDHQKSTLRGARKNVIKHLKHQKEQWNEFYNNGKFSGIGVIQLSSHARVIKENKKMEQYFGNLRRVPTDFSTIYDFKKGGKQTVKIAEEEYIMSPLSQIGESVNITYKIYHTGIFSGLRTQREAADKRYEQLKMAAKKTIEQTEKTIEQTEKKIKQTNNSKTN